MSNKENSVPLWFQIALKELGVSETVGVDHTPRVLEYHDTTTLDADTDEVPWCFTPDEEVLTEFGWMPFADVTKNIKVVQVNQKTLQTSLTKPIDIISYQHKGEICHVKNRDYDFRCSKDHRFFGEFNTSKKGEKYRKSAPISDVSCQLRIPNIQTGCEKDNISYTDDDLTLLAAFLSDGFLKKSRYTKNPSYIEIQVSKERKLIILDSLEYKHKYTAKKIYGKSKTPLTTYSFVIPDWLDSISVGYKMIDYSFLYSLSKNQLCHFLEMYTMFDGSTNPKNRNGCFVYTSSEYMRDFLLTATVLAGYMAVVGCSISPLSGKPCWYIRWTIGKCNKMIKNTNIQDIDYSGTLCCVEVPDGLIVVRGKNLNPFLTGNCSSFINWCITQAGLKGTNSAAARSWLEWGTRIEKPTLGCLVVFSRGSNPRSGHVGFYVESVNHGKHLNIIGGNQNNRVQLSTYPVEKVLAYIMPKKPKNKRKTDT